jgi:hypothetical protein
VDELEFEADPVPALSLVKVRGGYAVVLLHIDGRNVVDREVLTEGVVPFHHAETVYKVASVERLFPVVSN